MAESIDIRELNERIERQSAFVTTNDNPVFPFHEQFEHLQPERFPYIWI